jgi:hypothetical protein
VVLGLAVSWWWLGRRVQGRTALADAAVEQARRGGFEVLRGTPVAGRAGRWVWAQLVRDAGGPDELVARLLAEPGDVDLDGAAVALCSGPHRLIVADDVDRAARMRWRYWRAGRSRCLSRCS